MIRKLKDAFIGNAKNMVGPKTDRKLIVFSVDDYGNVRLDSKQARDNMQAAGMRVYSRFDSLDTLETKPDLEQLYEVLSSVTDKNGRHAIFTVFALPCNIDFETMASEDNEQYHYEALPETYKKLAKLQPEAYNGAWDLWKEGVAKGLLKPQFHGREHVNLCIFNDKLRKKDRDLLTALKNRSYSSISDDEYPTMLSTAAFDFWDVKENEVFETVIVDGLNQFEKVYGYRSNYFAPPVFNIHSSLFRTLKNNGIEYIDLGLVRKEHQGFGKFTTQFNYTGKKKDGLTIMVRNVVFEPTEDRGIDWVAFTIKQIEMAFRWNKPALISSHRVNFCGHIDPENRQKGLSALKQLLHEIIKKWPDAEFLSADEVGKILSK